MLPHKTIMYFDFPHCSNKKTLNKHLDPFIESKNFKLV